MRTPPKIHLFLFIINFIYAINYIVAKEIMPDYIGPLAMMFFRALGAIIIFTTIHLIWQYEKVERIDLLKIVGCAIFGVATNGMLFLKGISLTVPINASLIMILAPIIVMVLSYFFLKEKIGIIKTVGALIGLFGAYALITSFQPLQFSSNTVKGDVFILINAISFSIYLILAKELLKKYNPVTMARWLFTAGIFMVFPFAFPQLKELNFEAFGTLQYAAFFFIIIFPTCIAYLLYNIALKQVPASVASTYIFVQPLITTIIALSLGKDALTLPKFIGGTCILLGVAFVVFNKRITTLFTSKRGK